MSQNLCWRPVGKGHTVGGSQLREAVRKRYGSGPVKLGWDATPWLDGLADAEVEGAEKLANLISEHDGEIEVWIE